MTKRPIFIHSMFRAGSTYLFQAFRRAANPAYWCYQEPLHELFNDFPKNPSVYIELTSKQNYLLRHPLLDKPYLAEYIPLAEKIGTTYRQTFPYGDYFVSQESPVEDLRQYLAMLSEESPARPVIQCCRTTARLLPLRKCFPATHIFLWRNPWDQWWSYKVVPYFDTANLMILASPSAPPVMRKLRMQLGIDATPDCLSTQEAFTQSGERLLSSADSYRVFYALWLVALQQGFAHADFQISIDALSTSESYRHNALARFQQHGINNIDFSDCKIHRGAYGSRDKAFFQPIEAEIQDLFASYGEDISVSQHPEVINNHAEMPNDGLPTTGLWRAASEDLARMRELIIQSESFRSQTQRTIIRMQSENEGLQLKIEGLLLDIERLQLAEAELQSIYRSTAWRIINPFLKTYWRLRAIWRRYRADKQPPTSS